LNPRKLEAYLCKYSCTNNSIDILQDADSIRVSNIMRIGGGLVNDVYSFSITCAAGNNDKNLDFVIEIFGDSLDPLFESYLIYSGFKRCSVVYEVLRSLERAGFQVPKAYICEPDTRYLGHSFVIMNEVEQSQEINADYLKAFAKSLA
jgi:hypothetical protein